MKKNLMLVLIGFAFCAVLTSCAALKVAPAKFAYNDPAFSVEYPSDWKKGTTPGALLFVYTGTFKVPQMQIDKTIATGGNSQDTAKNLCKDFKEDRGSPYCKIKYAKDLKLTDGTPAQEFYVEWFGDGVPLHTAQFVIIKGKTVISATMTDNNPIGEELKTIMRSLKFD